MQHTDERRAMWRQFFKVWMPIFFTQLSLVAGSFFAAMMAGRHSTVDLAGVAVGVNLWIPVLMTSIGIFLGITPLISHLLGAGTPANIPSIIRQAVYLSIALGALALLLAIPLLPIFLQGLGLEPSVHYITLHFLTYVGLGMIPTFISITLRNAVDAHGYTKISLAIMTTGFLINILLNYCLITGYGFFPEMGGVGTGLAIALSNTFNCLCFFLVLQYASPFRKYRIFSHWERISFVHWREQLRIGIPLGAANFLEISLFSVVGLLITEYGTSIIAAHQAANNVSEIMYTLPLSAGIAATILCGFELGAARYEAARLYARMAQGFTVVIATGLFLLAVFHLPQIASIYTRDPQMILLIASFLPYALGFVFADATGTPIQGALRGYKDVNFVFYISLVSYWLVGLCLGYLLANHFQFGPYGYWMGIIAGLFIGSIFYNLRLTYLHKKLTQ